MYKVSPQPTVVRNLDNLELHAYFLWFSRLNYYPNVLKWLLGIANKNDLYRAVLEYFGEVPPQNTEEVLAYINSKNIPPLPNRVRRNWWLRLKKSVFMACLIYENKILNGSPIDRKIILNKIMNQYSHMFTRYFNSHVANDHALVLVDPIAFVDKKQDYESFLEFKDVKISGCGLILGKEIITTMDYSVHQGNFVSGLWDKVEFLGVGKKCNLINRLAERKSCGLIEKAIDLTGRTSGNYWHFMFEILPRIVGKNHQDTFPGIPLLINADTPVSCQDALHRMFPSSQFIAINSDEWITVRRLYSPFFLTKALDAGRCYPEEKFTWNTDSYPSILKSIKEWGHMYQEPSFSRSKIFITRKSSYRNVEGSEILETYLSGLGFTIINPSHLSLIEQIAAFSNASIIVGYGGAAWANLLFVRPDTKIVSIVSRASVTNDVHLQISRLLGLEFTRLICDLAEVKFEKFYSYIFFRDFVHSDFKISEEVLVNLSREL